MNIIVPKDQTVGYFVLDMRDALDGKEMRYDNGENSLPECVIVVPKKYLIINANGKYDFKLLNKYFREMVNKEFCADIKFAITKLVNAELSLNEDIKVVIMDKGEERITVAAPLWKNSVQLIEVVIKNPILELGETEKFIDVTDAGCCSCDTLFEVVPDCVIGNGVEQMIVDYGMNYNTGKKSKEKGTDFGLGM